MPIGYKYSQREVERIFEKVDCELLDEYSNVLVPVKYRCSCGNISYIAFHNFKNKGQRCRKCGVKRGAKAQTFSQRIVDQIFIDDGCELLDEYRNNHTLMKYRCNCGEISYIRLKDFKKGKRCKECGIRSRSGENSPRYNPRLTVYDRELRRHIPKYIKWKNYILQRDDYTCQCCSHRGGDLHAHHIHSYGNNELLRTDPGNGITLCIKCHRMFHHYFGWKENNLIQLRQFITQYREFIKNANK